MRLDRLKARPRKRFTRTTKADPKAALAPNILERCFETDVPNKVWVTDITYIPTTESWLFLAAIIDLYSRRAVGWATSDSLKTELAMRALRRALESRQPPPVLIHHSDRGCQCSAREHVDLLAEHGVTRRMSRAGNCHDNAVAEIFFGTFKHELERPVFPSRAAAHQATANYIDGLYNSIRRHSSADYLAPIDFERIAAQGHAA